MDTLKEVVKCALIIPIAPIILFIIGMFFIFCLINKINLKEFEQRYIEEPSEGL